MSRLNRVSGYRIKLAWKSCHRPSAPERPVGRCHVGNCGPVRSMLRLRLPRPRFRHISDTDPRTDDRLTHPAIKLAPSMVRSRSMDPADAKTRPFPKLQDLPCLFIRARSTSHADYSRASQLFYLLWWCVRASTAGDMAPARSLVLDSLYVGRRPGSRRSIDDL